MPSSDKNLSSSKKYGIFLSYALKDVEQYGENYIVLIKDTIESCISDISDSLKIFLSVDIKDKGEICSNQINDAIEACQLFICLLSDNYMKSDSCQHEINLWNTKEIRNGRRNKYIYPVYYVKINDELLIAKQPINIQNLLTDLEDNVPWFGEVSEKFQNVFIQDRLTHLAEGVKALMIKAQNTQWSFSSFPSSLCKKFIGRISEIRDLYTMCQTSYPIIQADAGVGKSELAIAYASYFADEYPEGRYFVRMNGINDWHKAFSLLLNSKGLDKDKKTISAKDFLEIDDYLIIDSEVHKEVIKKLIRKSSKGKILILFDNIEIEKILHNIKEDNLFYGQYLKESNLNNIHIILTTRLKNIDLENSNKFKLYTLGNLCDDDAVELFFQDNINNKNINIQPVKSHKEFQTTYDILHNLNNHAWAIDIVSSFIHENNKYEINILNNRNFDLLEFLQNIVIELKEEILELAVLASCFNSDNIPLIILRNYWKNTYPDVSCHFGEPFEYALKQLIKYRLLIDQDGVIKMQQLTQSVLKTKILLYLMKFGNFLKKCEFMSQEYWTILLLTSPDFFEFCPTYMISPKMWAEFLDEPLLAEKIQNEKIKQEWLIYCWNSLILYGEESELVKNFINKQQLASIINKEILNQNITQWEKIAWLGVISLFTQHFEKEFVEKQRYTGFNFSLFKELYHKIGFEWIYLLCKNFEFESIFTWEKLSGSDWSILLSHQPKFASKCPWEKLSGSDWNMLLSHQPKFAAKCQWEKLSGDDWSKLLIHQPKFASKCQWEKLSGYDWSKLLIHQPKFASKCQWEKLSERGNLLYWRRLLDVQPQFVKHCPEGIQSKESAEYWNILFKKSPNLYKQCPWDKLTRDDWIFLLQMHPQLANFFPWDNESGDDLSFLLQKQPQLFKYCTLDKLDENDWLELLIEQPQFSVYCPWEKLNFSKEKLFSSYLWCDLLIKYPQFADKCPWDIFDGYDWGELLERQPQFRDKCPWKEFSGLDWSKLLSKCPHCANQCPWELLTDNDWNRLLCNQPQFIDRYLCRGS